MRRYASATWRAGLRDGSGVISTGSKALSDTPYSFGTRFESAPGTNPEELVAAAHAACFSMALSAELEKSGFKPKSVSAQAAATLEKLDDGWRVTEMHLDVTAEIPGIGSDAFQAAAEEAKANCPISRLLNAKITLEAKLQQIAA